MLHTHYTCIESSTSDPAALLLTSLHTHYKGIEMSTERVKPFLPDMICILTIRVLKLSRFSAILTAIFLHTHYTGIEISENHSHTNAFHIFTYSLYWY